MAETAYIPDPKGLFSYLDFEDTEAGQNAGGGSSSSTVVGYPAGTKVYRALISQTGTNAPTAIVLENTLGGTPVWSYEGVGFYNLTLADVFTLNKTFVMAHSYAVIVSPIYLSDSALEFDVIDQNGNLADNIAELSPVEIVIFP